MVRSIAPPGRGCWPSCASATPTERRPAPRSPRPATTSRRGGCCTRSDRCGAAATHGEPELLAGAYRSSLRVADELGARSVAFPAISMGIYGYPGEDGARVAVATVAEHLRGETRVELARFVLFSEETYDLFAEALAELSVSRWRRARGAHPDTGRARTEREAVVGRRQIGAIRRRSPAPERYSPIEGPCLKPWPEPPPTTQAPAMRGWRSMMKWVSAVSSYWHTRPSATGWSASAGKRRRR